MTRLPATLVHDARVGDERAWEDLVLRYGGLLRGIARAFRLGPEQAADATQTTWMRLVENIGNVREPDRLAGWLSSTMRRECIRLVNSRRTEELTDDWTSGRFGHSAGPDVAVLRTELHGLLRSAMGQLPTRQRMVLLALAAEPQPSYEQVGAALSMAVGSIGPTRQRGLRRLRLLLAEAGIEVEVRRSPTGP
jgi:RNA polymerase sigma factor (sigma-70 family)